MPLITPSSRAVRPKWGRRFARSAIESMFPSLWTGKIGRWNPGLGVTGLKLWNLSGRGIHGTLTNMDITNWIIGQMGWALEFDAISTYVDTGNFNVSAALEFSFSAWVTSRIPDFTVGKAFSEGNIGLNNPSVGMGSGALGQIELVITNNAGATQVIQGVSTGLNDGAPHHIVCTGDGVTGKVYKDGDEDASTAFTLPGPITLNASAIGALIRTVPFAFWDGTIDNVHLYNRALLPSEVKLLFDIPNADLIPKLPIYGRGAAPIPPVESSLLPEYGQLRTAIGDPPVYGATILRS